MAPPVLGRFQAPLPLSAVNQPGCTGEGRTQYSGSTGLAGSRGRTSIRAEPISAASPADPLGVGIRRRSRSPHALRRAAALRLIVRCGVMTFGRHVGEKRFDVCRIPEPHLRLEHPADIGIAAAAPCLTRPGAQHQSLGQRWGKGANRASPSTRSYAARPPVGNQGHRLVVTRDLCADCGMRAAFFLVLVLMMPVMAHAAPLQGDSQATLCEQAITRAEVIGHTPPGMLAAIGQVESGRPDQRTGAMRSWPWTIDADGVGQFFATKAQAVAAVAALQAEGVRSIDVGCMQVNLMHHPDAFASLDQAFDPVANTTIAMRFLNALYRSTGSWPKAIAAYHSDTPSIAGDYQRRVLVTWQQHVASPPGERLIYADDGLIYGAFGSTGRIYGIILPGR